MLSKHISLKTPLSGESRGAGIGCNHVDRWLTFYCSIEPNLQGWWWIQTFWNDAMSRILWLIHGATVVRHWALSHVYVSCIKRHVWRACTVGNAEMSVSPEDNRKGRCLDRQVNSTASSGLCMRIYAGCKNQNALFCLMPANTSQTLISCPIDLTECAGSWRRTQILPGVAP